MSIIALGGARGCTCAHCIFFFPSPESRPRTLRSRNDCSCNTATKQVVCARARELDAWIMRDLIFSFYTLSLSLSNGQELLRISLPGFLSDVYIYTLCKLNRSYAEIARIDANKDNGFLFYTSGQVHNEKSIYYHCLVITRISWSDKWIFNRDCEIVCSVRYNLLKLLIRDYN